ncbi:dynein heavy chain, cytosolic [Reticulomyxa filosa]|uniref:Dynein heavy chain, cytosolic n=1 Tax=Reticulomyxa filosa TaxID=46433 RepID=X6LUS5_RETFI|nr:dynein heavy chain, cytosolic [Reticulomyxa filosa]|eukprot:ETO04867.1 dynein heavy chain, cytosolic [Reticulomyxa filosa]
MQPLQRLAKQLNRDIRMVPLESGQTKTGTSVLQSALTSGHWVYLANCHLSITWMSDLEQLIESYCTAKNASKPHPDFRLWLSSKPNPQFPVSILQRSLKITIEPPSGLKMNMKRLYDSSYTNMFNKNILVIYHTGLSLQHCNQVHFRKLLFGLTWFHSLLLERRKFGSLGWNAPYNFLDSDFQTSLSILSLYLNKYKETPWDAIKYLIGDINYGGRVTNAMDRRLMNVYVSQIFCENCVKSANYMLSELPTFYVPDDGPLKNYQEYIESLPSIDHAGAFGQHPNADTFVHAEDSSTLLDALASFQESTNVEQGKLMEETISTLCEELLQSIPVPLDIQEIKRKQQIDDSPLTIVLFQEIERYNHLLQVIKKHLILLRKGVQGSIVLSSEMEDSCLKLYNNKVPDMWKNFYPSLKSLGGWIVDLKLRVHQLHSWAYHTVLCIVLRGKPKVFWLSGFMFPSSFLTVLLQVVARKQKIAIDHLNWEYNVINDRDDLNGDTIQMHPKEGAYIRGLYVEGASWNFADGCLTDSLPMKMTVQMPVIHFKPVEKKKSAKGMENQSFICSVDLKSGKVDASELFLSFVAKPSAQNLQLPFEQIHLLFFLSLSHKKNLLYF